MKRQMKWYLVVLLVVFLIHLLVTCMFFVLPKTSATCVMSPDNLLPCDMGGRFLVMLKMSLVMALFTSPLLYFVAFVSLNLKDRKNRK